MLAVCEYNMHQQVPLVETAGGGVCHSEGVHAFNFAVQVASAFNRMLDLHNL
jgi:hypothetical protein